MAKYAKTTTVPVSRSRTHIEELLERYGAGSFCCGWDRAHGVSAVGFEFNGLMFRVEIPIPKECTPQEERQRWRVLWLVIKAKLEAVDSGVSTIGEEFLANVVTPGGTLGSRLLPQLDHLAKNGQMPVVAGSDGGSTVTDEGPLMHRCPVCSSFCCCSSWHEEDDKPYCECCLGAPEDFDPDEEVLCDASHGG